MKNVMKRTLSGVLAVLCVAGYLPASTNVGTSFGDTAITASALMPVRSGDYL